MTIGSVINHRDREKGAIVYPVYSRRAGGLSIGVNLFPDSKTCSFNCPYCEVFPFETKNTFTMEAMKADLCEVIQEAKSSSIPIKDICFSGNGEPTMSPFFIEALTAAAAIQKESCLKAKLVMITNGTGLLNPVIFEFLKTASVDLSACIWLKLDAATETWYKAMARPAIPLGKLLSCIRDFAVSGSPFTIQTMLCKIEGVLPPPEESAAYIQLVTDLAVLSKTGLRQIQLYGKARPAPQDPLAEEAPPAVLEERAAMLCRSLDKAGASAAVNVYL